MQHGTSRERVQESSSSPNPTLRRLNSEKARTTCRVQKKERQPHGVEILQIRVAGVLVYCLARVLLVHYWFEQARVNGWLESNNIRFELVGVPLASTAMSRVPSILKVDAPFTETNTEWNGTA
jgi:hypothetical protein